MRSLVFCVALLSISVTSFASGMGDIQMPISPADQQALEADHDFILQHHNAINGCSEIVRCGEKQNDKFVRVSISRCTAPENGRQYYNWLESVQYGPGNHHITQEATKIDASESNGVFSFDDYFPFNGKHQIVMTNGSIASAKVFSEDQNNPKQFIYSYSEADLDCKNQSLGVTK